MKNLFFASNNRLFQARKFTLLPSEGSVIAVSESIILAICEPCSFVPSIAIFCTCTATSCCTLSCAMAEESAVMSMTEVYG